MDPALIFFAVRSLIRIGTAARSAYEQSVRDDDFKMPKLPFPDADADTRIQEYFNERRGIARGMKLTAGDGPLSRYWLPDDFGGTIKKPVKSDELSDMYSTFFSVIADAKRQATFDANVPKQAGHQTNWIALRALDGEGTTELLEQWATDAQPVRPELRIALALADVALDYVGSNPGIVGVGSSGETLLRAVCVNLQAWIPVLDNGKQSVFVERMAAAILQSGLQALTDKADVLLPEKATAALVGKMAKPLAELFDKAVRDDKPIEQLTLAVIRDTVFPQMVSAGLSVLADHQRELLGGAFDPSDTLGYFTKGFLQALSEQSVLRLGNAQAWFPIYKALLHAAAARPNLIVKGATDDRNAEAVRDLIKGVAGMLENQPFPYTRDTAIDLALVVVDVLQKELPSRTSDPWELLIPAALKAAIGGLRDGGSDFKKLAQDEVAAVIRAVLQQVAATPGMIIGPTSSVEVQEIITAIAKAMVADDKFLVSKDGWIQIAAVTAAAAARNPGKLFNISTATPEGQLASLLISRVLEKASASFSKPADTRSKGVVLFGDTLVNAIKDTLTAAAGNAKGAFDQKDHIKGLVDQLNGLVNPDRQLTKTPQGAVVLYPIGAADWSFLFRVLIVDLFANGPKTYTDQELKNLLSGHR